MGVKGGRKYVKIRKRGNTVKSLENVKASFGVAGLTLAPTRELVYLCPELLRFYWDWTELFASFIL